MHARHSRPRKSIAIVGGETLLGKEVNELLEARKLPASIELVASFDPDASTKAATILAIGKEEPLVMISIAAADLASAQIVILASSRESGRSGSPMRKIRGAKASGTGCDRSHRRAGRSCRVSPARAVR